MPQAGLAGSSQVQQSKQYASLADFLANKTQLNDAFDAFCEPAESEFKTTGSTEEVEEHLTISWRALLSQAAQVSFRDERQQKLVQFITELQQRQTLQKDGQACQIQGMTIWQDLPTFGQALRNAWNLAADDTSAEESQEQWINLNAFTATLLGSTFPKSGDNLGLSLFCIWTIRQALEEGENTSSVAVAAASTWFVFAAPTMKKLCEQQKSFDGKVAQPGANFGDSDWKGFSQNRWQAWANKLAAAESDIADSTASELLKQARIAVEETKQS